MNNQDVHANLKAADLALKAARSARRKADTELARAEATQAKATEAELAADSRYKAARDAMVKAYPQHNRG